MVPYIFQDQRIDYVFHLAAFAAEGLSHFVRRFNYDNNLPATRTLITESVNAGTVECFVFASSIAVYGDARPPIEIARPLPPSWS